MKTPRSSIAPARSASPSRRRPRSKPPPATIPSASSTFGRIGSGLTPPNHGLRSAWISHDVDPSAGEQPADPAGPGAPQRVDEDPRVGGPERVEVERPPDEPLVARDRGRSARRDRPPRRRRRAGPGSAGRRSSAITASSVASSSGPAAAPVGALTLNPLSVHGLWLAVMTMPAAAPALDDLEARHLGRHGRRGEGDRDVVAEEDLRGGGGEVLRRRSAGRRPRRRPWPPRRGRRRSGRRPPRSGGRSGT